MERVEENLIRIQERVLNAANAAGRDADDIAIMAVTKTFDRGAVDAAYNAGIRLFGENRVFEAAEKYESRPADLRLHLVGHLQRNKAKTAAAVFDCVESIDKIATATALEKNCSERSTVLDILLEYNTSDESAKSGIISNEDLFSCCDKILELPHLRLKGMMTIAPFTDDKSRIRSSFALLRSLFEEIKDRYNPDDFDTLSMGMSGDFELAIAEGSTCIRVGTALFRSRDT